MLTTANVSRPEGQGREPDHYDQWSPDIFFMTMAKLGIDADFIARQVDRRREEIHGKTYSSSAKGRPARWAGE